jgi:hypothetical protein
MAAVIGGTLRIASTFVPYEPDSGQLETLYGVIDLCLLFGLIAIYITSAEAVGVAGLGFFIVALAGLASIVGPDAQAFGIDFYRVGALVFVAGLAGLSIQLLRVRLMAPSAVLWIMTFAAGLASTAVPQAFLASGLCLGVSFVLAGIGMLWRRRAPALVAAA